MASARGSAHAMAGGKDRGGAPKLGGTAAARPAWRIQTRQLMMSRSHERTSAVHAERSCLASVSRLGLRRLAIEQTPCHVRSDVPLFPSCFSASAGASPNAPYQSISASSSVCAQGTAVREGS